MSDTRKQINFRVSDTTLERIDVLRSKMKPLPNVSEFMHLAIDAMEREIERELASGIRDRVSRTNGNGSHHDGLDATTIRLAVAR